MRWEAVYSTVSHQIDPVHIRVCAVWVLCSASLLGVPPLSVSKGETHARETRCTHTHTHTQTLTILKHLSIGRCGPKKGREAANERLVPLVDDFSFF